MRLHPSFFVLAATTGSFPGSEESLVGSEGVFGGVGRGLWWGRTESRAGSDDPSRWVRRCRTSSSWKRSRALMTPLGLLGGMGGRRHLQRSRVPARDGDLTYEFDVPPSKYESSPWSSARRCTTS